MTHQDRISPASPGGIGSQADVAYAHLAAENILPRSEAGGERAKAWALAMKTLMYEVRVSRGSEAETGRGFTTYHVELEERMTVLDALFQILRNQDQALVFRCACRVGMCGTCALLVNGIPRLACKTRPSQLPTGPLTLEPLPNLPVIKDLAVSMEPFFEQWMRVIAEFRPADPDDKTLKSVPATSQYARQTPGKRDCITCGACYAACGITGAGQHYLGPAALNQAYLRIMDPRDRAWPERLQIIGDERCGARRCDTRFDCTTVCPKGISVTDSIVRLKRLLLHPSMVEKL